MPIIPRLTNKGINTTVPAANIKVGDGGLGDSMARLGNIVTNIGVELSNQTMEAEAKDYAANRKIGDTLKIEEFKKESLVKYADSPDDYNKNVKEFIDKTYQKSQEDAPTGLAQEIYKGASQTSFVREQLEIDAFTANQKLQLLKVNSEKRTQGISMFAYQSPDSVKVGDLMNTELNIIESKVGSEISRSQAEVEKMKIKQDVSGSYFQGLLDDEQYGIAKKVLKDEKNPVTSALTVDQRSRIENRLDSAIKQRQEKDGLLLNETKTALSAAVKSGTKVNDSTFIDLYQRVSNSPSIQQDKKVVMQAEIIKDYAVMKSASDIATMRDTEWSEKFKNIENDVKSTLEAYGLSPEDPKYGAIVQEQILKSKADAKTVMDNVFAERESRTVPFMHKNFPKLKSLYDQSMDGNPATYDNYVKELLTTQKLIGVRRPTILEPGESQKLSETINVPNSADQKIFVLNNLKNKYGKYSSLAVSELVRDGKVDNGILLAVNAKDESSSMRILSNMEDPVNKLNRYKDFTNEVAAKNLREEVARTLAPEISALRSAGNTPMIEGLQQAMVDNITTDLASRSQRRVTRSDILQAKNIILGERTKISSGNSTVFQPNTIGNPNTTSQFLKKSTSETGLSFYGIKAPPDQIAAYRKKGFSKETDEELNQMYIKTVSKNAYWAPTTNPNVLRLMAKNLGMDIKPVQITDKDERPITISFDRMSTLPFMKEDE